MSSSTFRGPNQSLRRQQALTFISPFGVSSSVVCAASAQAAAEAKSNMIVAQRERNSSSSSSSSSSAVSAATSSTRTELHRLRAISSMVSGMEASVKTRVHEQLLPQLSYDVLTLRQCIDEVLLPTAADR
ncbi:Hypothetical protein, putative [Bodo saltans]|uniref:Uncharacterized protein n=1 Tax=Bodo saltans TaxID=75058 RepID=A0A0S4JJR7_BODSA|nr:Hypothetical protein, putative [Bodo saltans]|eukprot:CUG90432.1 Hypothetical protein, putative [Bodo saltans]